MKLRCRLSAEQFDFSDEDSDALARLAPKIRAQKFELPPPDIHPTERLRRRFAFRNDRVLYRQQSSLSGKELLTTFAPDSPFSVIEQQEWWGDTWDAMSYQRDINFAQSFSEQFGELLRVVPHIGLRTSNAENSHFTNFATNVKNCYLSFACTASEGVLYSKAVFNSRDIIDSLTVTNSELGYQLLTCEHCYNCAFLDDCRNCNDCLFCEDCQSCSNCILCFGLTRSEHCILNQPVTPSAFQDFRKKLVLSHAGIEECREQLKQLASTLPHRHAYIFNSEQCTGDAITNSKNCHNCFDVIDCEDSRHLYWAPKTFNSVDCSFCAPWGVRSCYECFSAEGSEECLCCFSLWNCSRCLYCIECSGCKDCFGCTGLKNKQYCILNKEYNRSEYEVLFAKLVSHMTDTGEWGRFFDPGLSYYAYNETIAQEHFPLDQAEAEKMGYRWKPVPPPASTDGSQKLPETIDGVTDDWLNRTLYCENTHRPFKLNPYELKLLRIFGAPLPRLCPDERHRARIMRKRPLKLWTRQCGLSGRTIYTNYPPESPLQIVDAECLQRARE